VRKIFLLSALSLFLAITFTGCYDKRETNDIGYILTMGMDKGVTDKLRLTLQVLTYKGEGGEGMGGGGGGGGGGDKEAGAVDGTVVTTVDCPSLTSGLNLANAGSPRQFNLMHTKLLVFSEEIARSGELENYLDDLARYREMHAITHVVIARGKAEDFIMENKPVLGENPIRSMQVLLNYRYYTGYFPHTRLFDFHRAVKSTAEQPITMLIAVNSLKNLKEPGQGEKQELVSGGEYLAGELPRKGGSKRELFGAAVFRGAKMTGEINGDEVRVLDMIKGEFGKGFFTIPDPRSGGHIVNLDIHQARNPRVKVSFRGGFPEIDVKIRLEGDIMGVQSGINYEKTGLKPVLEQAFEREIKESIDNLIEKCQQEFQADIFGFGNNAISQFATIEEWEKYKWLEKFPSAKVATQVDFIIRRTGMILKSSPIVPGGEGA